MLEIKDELHSGGSFVGVTASHHGSQGSQLIKDGVNVCTPVVLWIIFHL